MNNKTGKIVKIVSNLYTVSSDNKLFECRARGKFRFDKISPLVGDIVDFDANENYIINIHERKNSLNRPQISNVDVALIVTSIKKPDLSLNLLDKLILVIKHSNIEPVICVTKMDLVSFFSRGVYKKLFKYYENIGIKVFYNNDLSGLKKYLNKKIVVLTGQTGAGKSSLLNKLNKDLNLDTNPISEALGRGVHTTRHTEIHEISNIYFADTPGFSSINLDGITKESILVGFPEFSNYECDFKDCKHIDEKSCKVKDAVNSKKILKSRYEDYKLFMKELD
ncbi:MAG: ribosome small subunit-dependent GTPase A [Bacilli bacterium]|nr:ribosome small subunit-dependent GTPase A [Bacilli bacterium]